jgi:phytoene dehydrogenase-like protein
MDPMPSRKSRIPGVVWVGIAFVPWILYWVLSAENVPLYGTVLALSASVLLVGYRALGKKIMIMDIVTLLYFIADFAFTIVLGSTLFLRFGGLLVYLVLSGMAFVSLAVRSPFTYQYARQDWPREYWDMPLFRSTNNTITAIWGLIFLAGAILYESGSVMGSIIVSTASPNLLLGLGIVFSIAYPKWRVKKAIVNQISQAGKSLWASPTLADGSLLAENEYDVAIVGSGIGGLSCGALLAKRGLKVLVLEQHYLAGGYCTSFPRKGHSTFDAGVHEISGLGPKGPVRYLLRELAIENKLEFKRVTSEYVFSGIRFQVPHDWKDFVNLLGTYFPAEKMNILAFFDEMKGIYDDIYRDLDVRKGVIGPPETVEEMMKYPLTHRYLFRWLNKSYLEMLNKYFSDARLKEILCTLTGYLTDDPKALQAFSMAPIFGYYFDGGYYPKGSSQALADALVSVIRNNGGTVLLNTRVRRILVKEGAADGVSVESTPPRQARTDVYKAGIVISNADIKQTFLHLIEPDSLPAEYLKRLQDIEPSTSAFMVFLSLDYDPPLAPLTFYMPDTGPGVGIAIPSKLDSNLAARGGSALTILTLIPNSEAKEWNRGTPDYGLRKEKFMEQLIDAVASLLPDLRSHIVYKEAATPATFLRYTSSCEGAIYGPKLGQGLSFKSPIRNLYLVGSGTFPGAGTEAVVISALNAANDILSRNADLTAEKHPITESTLTPYLTVRPKKDRTPHPTWS